MRSLLNNSEERRLTLIEILSFYCNSAKKDEVLKIMDYKENTLRSDIDYINEKYEKILKLTLSTSHINLEYFDNQSISTFSEIILDNLIIFKLVENIFFDKYSSIEDLSSHLYTSPSTVYRLIDKFNESAGKCYNIGLDTRNIHFTGDERDIRDFFIQFFAEKYSLQKWPFKDIDKSSVQNLIIELSKFYNVKLNYSDLETMCLTCAVNISSYLDGFSIDVKDVNSISKDIYQKYFVDKQPPQIIKKELENLGLDTSFQSIYNVFHNYMHKDFIYSFDYFLNLPIESDEYFEIRKSIHSLFSVIYNLIKEFDTPVINTDELAVILHNESLLFNSRPRSNFILYNANQFYIKKMKINYENLVNASYKELKNYLVNMKGHADEQEIHYLIYRLISTWIGLTPRIILNKKKVKILVASLTNFHHSISMKEFLETILSDFIEIDIYDEQIFDVKKVDDPKYDFVITDFSLNLKNGPEWKYFHGDQSYNNIMQISQIIYKKFFEKNK